VLRRRGRVCPGPPDGGGCRPADRPAGRRRTAARRRGHRPSPALRRRGPTGGAVISSAELDGHRELPRERGKSCSGRAAAPLHEAPARAALHTMAASLGTAGLDAGHRGVRCRNPGEDGHDGGRWPRAQPERRTPDHRSRDPKHGLRIPPSSTAKRASAARVRPLATPSPRLSRSPPPRLPRRRRARVFRSARHAAAANTAGEAAPGATAIARFRAVAAGLHINARAVRRRRPITAARPRGACRWWCARCRGCARRRRCCRRLP